MVITLIPGDGIGPEITSAVVKILETAGLDVEWESHLAGESAIEQRGATLPAELLESIATPDTCRMRSTAAVTSGPIPSPGMRVMRCAIKDA